MVTTAQVEQYWSLIENDPDTIYHKLVIRSPDYADFGSLDVVEIRRRAKTIFDKHVPKIRKELCETKMIDQLSEASAKDIVLPLAVALGGGKPTALLTMVAAIAVKLALQGLCGKELSII